MTDAMTGAAWRAATEMGAAAIIGISDSGFTVRSIARFRPAMPILGFSPNERTVRQLTMSWGTIPLHAPVVADSLEMMQGLVDRGPRPGPRPFGRHRRRARRCGHHDRTAAPPTCCA